MRDEDKTREQLLDDLRALRARLDDRVRTVAALDVTEREAVQAEQDQLQDRLRLQIERLPLAYILIDASGSVRDWNPAAERLFGYTREEALGRPCLDLIVPLPVDDHLQEIIRRIWAGDMGARSINENRTKDGRIITCEWSNTPLAGPDHRFSGVISLAQDITERMLAGEKLRRSEALLAQAERLVHLGSWEWHIPTNTVIWSDEQYRLFGLRPGEFGATYEAFLERVHPDDREGVTAVNERALRNHSPFEYSYRIVRPDGVVRVMQACGQVALDGSGTGVRLIGACQDVTERKRAEQELQQHTARLQALSRRLVEVQEEERRHLARELHDQIGQILTGLKFALEAATSAPLETAGAKLGEVGALIGEALARVRELSFDLRPALLDHLGLLPALRWLIERYSASTGVRVNFKHTGLQGRFAPELETAAYRIVQEALTNVARHARVSEAAVRLWVDAGTLEVQIEDEGAGFDPEEVLAAGRSSGLSGMHERAALLGGRLAVASTPGGGTHLLAELPLGGHAGAKIDEYFHRLGR